MLRMIDRWEARVLYASLITVAVATFAWFYHKWLAEASLFFGLAVVLAVLLYRVVAQSVRAFTVMRWTFLLTYLTLISTEGHLGGPAAGPWFLGFLVGAIAGGYTWIGPRAGKELRQPRRSFSEADGTFAGGRPLAVINAVCALVLLGIGGAQIVLLSPTVWAGAVLALAVLAGWALFRFPPAVHIRNALLLAIPVGFIAFGFLGGATGQLALPSAWAYGVLAGILIGGRYWSGTRCGAPRPPFNVQARRRRRRRRPRPEQKQSPKREKPVAGAARR